jgi:hypothetical protein
MFLYSHLYYAVSLEHCLQPEDPAQYYLGAVAPDLRYPAGLRRQQTHLSSIAVLNAMDAHSELRSFLLGYLLHCETDLLDLTVVLFGRSLLRFLSKRVQLQLTFVYLEDWYLAHERLNPHVAEQGNAMLAQLGVPDELVQRYAGGINLFLKAPSLEREIQILSGDISMKHRVGASTRLLIRLLTHPVIKRLMLAGVPLERVAREEPGLLARSQPLAWFAAQAETARAAYADRTI